MVSVPPNVALYLLNQKRHTLSDVEKRYGFSVSIESDDELHAADCEIERVRSRRDDRERPAQETARATYEEVAGEAQGAEADGHDGSEPALAGEREDEDGESRDGGRRRRRRRRRRGRRDGEADAGERLPQHLLEEPAGGEPGGNGAADEEGPEPVDEAGEAEALHGEAGEDRDDGDRRRRRGRRGGRRRRRDNGQDEGQGEAYARDEAPDQGHAEPVPLDGQPVERMPEHHLPVEHAPFDAAAPAAEARPPPAPPAPPPVVAQAPQPVEPPPPPPPSVPPITAPPDNPTRGWWRR
jgi:ribonuclease E